MVFLKAGTNIMSSVFFRKHILEAKIRGAQDFNQEAFWDSDGGQLMGTRI